MAIAQISSYEAPGMQVFTESPRISIFLDWDENSSKAFKEVLEAKKELLLRYLLDIDVECNYINIHTGAYMFTEKIPSVYVNGRLISCGRPPTKEEIIQAVLEMDNSHDTSEATMLVTQKENEPPMNSAVMLEI